jgi:hypothetical protein
MEERPSRENVQDQHVDQPEPHSEISIRATNGDIEIAAAKSNNPIAAASSNLFLGEIPFVETFNFYFNVSA